MRRFDSRLGNSFSNSQSQIDGLQSSHDFRGGLAGWSFVAMVEAARET
jgi:hypothetical protein